MPEISGACPGSWYHAEVVKFAGDELLEVTPTAALISMPADGDAAEAEDQTSTASHTDVATAAAGSEDTEPVLEEQEQVALPLSSATLVVGDQEGEQHDQQQSNDDIDTPIVAVRLIMQEVSQGHALRKLDRHNLTPLPNSTDDSCVSAVWR